MVAINARVAVFREIYNTLNDSPPTYTDRDSSTKTYSIFSSFPEVTPVFPCIVINPVVMNTRSLGVSKLNDKKVAKGYIELEFFAKVRDGKNAVDSAKDTVQGLIDDLDSTSFYLTSEPYDDEDSDMLEVGDQKLNTVSLTINITFR